MKIKKLIAGLTLTATMMNSAVAAEWKFAIEEIPGGVMDTYAKAFKEKIESKTKGDITVKIYPLGSLGTPTELVDQVADGVVQFVNVSVGNLGTIVPESQIFSLPYTLPADNKKTSDFLANSPMVYNELSKDFSKKSLELLTMYSEGAQVWTTNKAIRTPADFDNFKMRVMVSPILLKAYEDMGASPTPLPFGEVYGALQLKQVDGQVNPVAAIEEMKFYEVTDYMIWAGENQHVVTVLSGTDWFESLSLDKKKLVTETMAELNGIIFDIVEKFNKEKLKKIKSAKPDIQLITLTDKEQEVFRQRSKGTHSAYIDIAGKRGQKLLDALKKEIQ